MLGDIEGGQGRGYRWCTGLKLGFPGKLDVLFLLVKVAESHLHQLQR